MRHERKSSFGFIAAIGVNMAFQDYHGLEGYIEYCRGHWVDLPVWVGCVFALSSIGCAAVRDFHNKQS